MKGNFAAVKKIIQELTHILSGEQKRRAAVVLVVIVIGSGFELLGVSAVMPFLQAILTPETLMESKYLQPIVRLLGIETANGVLILVGAGLMLVYILKNVFMIFSNYVQYDYSTRVRKELTIKMLHSYMSRPYTFFLNVNMAEILRGCNEDIEGVYAILSHLFTIMAELLAAILIACYIIYTEPLTAAAAVILILAVMMGIVLFFKPLMKRLGRTYMGAQAAKNKAICQTISGVKELYAMQRQDLFVEEYEAAADKVRKTQRNYEFVNNSPDRIVEGVCLSGLIGIVLIRLLMGVDMVAFVPKLGSFAMAAFKLLPSIGKISNRVTGIVYHKPRLDNVYHNILEAETYEKECEEESRRRKRGQEIDRNIDFQEMVSVENIVWQYEGQMKPVLTDVSFHIHKGESVALIGASGSGKTTLSDILLGLLTPAKGSIYMDGIDIYTIPRIWARIVGYVPQSVFLIDDTIRNNVAFGLKDVNDADIWRALEQAQLKAFVETLPAGLDTIVGERGIKFSGGQRQRVAIARALFNKPEILILDEATAALDNETEKAVMESIDALQGQITMVIVAHRLTTIRNCDAIYEIKEGKAIRRSKSEVFGEIK